MSTSDQLSDEDLSTSPSESTPRSESSDISSTSTIDSDEEGPTKKPSSASRSPPPRVPKLGLAVPRLNFGGAAPVDMDESDRESPTATTTAMQDISNEGRSRTTQLAVELLSPAFELPANQNVGDYDKLKSRCAEKLGIRQERLQLYALLPIDSIGALPNGCDRIAIEVQGSGKLTVDLKLLHCCDKVPDRDTHKVCYKFSLRRVLSASNRKYIGG